MSNAMLNGMAGATGGIIAQIMTYPLQTVNTRHQTERVAKDSTSSAFSSLSGNTVDRILQVIRSEGLAGLYSGLKPSLFGTAASQGIYYYFYQAFKNKAEAIATKNKIKGLGDGTPGMLSWLIVAALAGSLNVLFTIPIWVLVTRMQTHTQAEAKMLEAKREALLKESSINFPLGASSSDQLAMLDSIKPRPYGTFQAACEVYRESGIAGFWKGIIPTLIMVCNPSIQFMIYEGLLKRLRSKRSAKKQSSVNITAMEIFVVGAIAKLGATICTYPLLVVKSRLQAKQEIGENASLRYSGSYPMSVCKDLLVESQFQSNVAALPILGTGTVDAIIKMIRYEGLGSFYKGMSTKIVQSVLAASILFMVKEEIVKMYAAIATKGTKHLRKIAK